MSRPPYSKDYFVCSRWDVVSGSSSNGRDESLSGYATCNSPNQPLAIWQSNYRTVKRLPAADTESPPPSAASRSFRSKSAIVRASFRMRWKARALSCICCIAERSRLLPVSSSPLTCPREIQNRTRPAAWRGGVRPPEYRVDAVQDLPDFIH